MSTGERWLGAHPAPVSEAAGKNLRPGIAVQLSQCAVFYSVAVAAIGIVFFVAVSTGVDFYDLTRDPFAGRAHDIPFYTSILSNAGIVAWCVTATAQWFAAFIVRRIDPGSREGAFLVASGFLTAGLMLDDLLMVHERLGHLVEAVVFGVYGLCAVAIVVRFRDIVLRGQWLLLGLALACFAMSIVLDSVVTAARLEVPYRVTLEDAFKMLGIAGWTYYFLAFSLRAVARRTVVEQAG